MFEKHLKSRSAEISSAISLLFSQKTNATPEVSELQGRVAHLLSVEKSHVNELEKSRLEKEQLEERLESASMRYMVAEKKLDRAKSMTVAKLERQALAGGRSDSGSGLGGSVEAQGPGKNDVSNGQLENSEMLAEAEEARKEAVAASAKQKDQLGKLEAENEKLTSQLTALNVKFSHLSDDDYARTDLFKHLKSQHEDVIKRINDLEATNVQLREEAAKLQAERTAYRVQLENESQVAVSEKEAQLAKAESDLARIRTGRDELNADLQMRKAAQDQDRASISQVKQLALAREERVKALESEVERLRMHAGQSDCLAVPDGSLAELSIEDLRTKYSNLDRQYVMLGEELTSMGTAYKRASAAASQKINDASALEEKVHRLGAEKSKADQKYFAAMKAKEAREQEVRTFRAQNSKSSDIVSQLKDAEASTRALVANLEKHLVEAKDALNNMTKQHRTSQQQLVEKNITTDGLKAQVEELKKALSAKDTTTSALSSSHRRAEVEVEELKVKLEETKKSLETWKTKGLGNQSGEYEMLRVSPSSREASYCKANNHRTSPYVPSAERTSKTLPSKLAVTFSVRIVLKNGSNLGCANAPIATKPLVKMTTCESLFKKAIPPKTLSCTPCMINLTSISVTLSSYISLVCVCTAQRPTNQSIQCFFFKKDDPPFPPTIIFFPT